MKLTRVFRDEDAVSPVIGVILMVAVTVIMAAITGAFVLSLQSDVSVTPTTSWDTSTEDTTGNGTVDRVKLLHRAGDTLQADQLTVRVAGQQADVTTPSGEDQVRVGDTIDVRLDDSSGSIAPGDELLLVWSPSDSEDSVILTSHRFLVQYGDTLDRAEVN